MITIFNRYYTLAALALASGSVPVHAQDLDSWHPKTLSQALINSALFGFAGIVLLALGFKIFDKLLTRVDIEGEIQKGNIAAAILAAAVLIGIALVLAAAIS